MFGASGAYHLVRWTWPRWRPLMRRIDHAGIYLMIAGQLHAGRAADPRRATGGSPCSSVVWTGAAIAIVLKVCWLDAPKWLAAAIAITLGWVAVLVMPQVWDERRPHRLRADRRRRDRVHASAASSTRSSARIRCPPCSATTRSSTRSCRRGRAAVGGDRVLRAARALNPTASARAPGAVARVARGAGAARAFHDQAALVGRRRLALPRPLRRGFTTQRLADRWFESFSIPGYSAYETNQRR